MDDLMNILCVFSFVAQVNAPNLPNISESLPLTNDLQMPLTREVNSPSKRQAEDLQIFKERVSDEMYRVWMSPTFEHSFRVASASGTEEEFIGCSEHGSENSGHLIYIRRPSSWQYVYFSGGSIQIDGRTYNISQIDEIAPLSGPCLDAMLLPTVTTTETVTETSEMTATTCDPDGTSTPVPSVNPGTIPNQIWYSAATVLAPLLVIAIIIIIVLGVIIACLCFKLKKAREPMDAGNPNGFGENQSIHKLEKSNLSTDDGYRVKNTEKDKGGENLKRGSNPPKSAVMRGESYQYSNNESREKTNPSQAFSEIGGTEDTSKDMKWPQLQPVSDSKHGTSASTYSGSRTDDYV